MTRQAVTKHLQVLEAAGLVRSARVGRESLYSYQPEPVCDARAYLEAVSAQWDARLARLKALVEEIP
jgi:DNA-binding transcriptional ArsR family regulator